MSSDMHISQERISIADGSSEYMAKTFSGADVQTDPALRPHVVIANGWIASMGTSGRIARGLVRAAGGDLAVTVYDDPLVGSSAYGQSYKTERLVRTVEAVGASPLTLLGHSRGWLSAAYAGADLIKQERVRALAGLTPMGLGEARELHIGQTVARVGKEIITSACTISDVGSIAVIGTVVCRGLTHSSVNPLRAIQELKEVLCTDATACTVELSHEVPTTMITGKHDALVPTTQLQNHLADNGYAGTFAVIPTSHVGAVSDMRAMKVTYAGLQAVL